MAIEIIIIIITTIVIAIESIMVLTEISNATHPVIVTDHTGTDAMVAGNKKNQNAII